MTEMILVSCELRDLLLISLLVTQSFFSPSFCRPEAIYAAVNKRPNTQSYPAGEGKTAWKTPTNATVWFCLMTCQYSRVCEEFLSSTLSACPKDTVQMLSC